jgi:hypothetical protein
MQASVNVPDQVFPHPNDGATRLSGVDPTTSDALRLSGSSVSPARATGMARQGHPTAAIRLSEPSAITGTGQPGPGIKDRSDGWQMSNRSLIEGKMGQPVLLEIREKLDVQPLELPFGKTGATRMYRSGGSNGRNRFKGRPPWKVGGQPPSPREDRTSKHHTPDGSRSSRGTGQPDPPDVTTQIQGPTKAGIGATRYLISIGPLEQEEIPSGTGQPEPPGISFW